VGTISKDLVEIIGKKHPRSGTFFMAVFLDMFACDICTKVTGTRVRSRGAPEEFRI